MKKGRRLGELCKQLDLQPYVLRYWITEFPQLGGAESANAPNRVFSPDEVAVVRRIQQLLYEEGYTIAGAKKKLESEPAPTAKSGRASAAPLFDPSDEGEEPAGDKADEIPAPESVTAVEAQEYEEEAFSAAADATLDTRSDERIETFRRQVEMALKEARAILERLQRPRS